MRRDPRFFAGFQSNATYLQSCMYSYLHLGIQGIKNEDGDHYMISIDRRKNADLLYSGEFVLTADVIGKR